MVGEAGRFGQSKAAATEQDAADGIVQRDAVPDADEDRFDGFSRADDGPDRPPIEAESGAASACLAGRRVRAAEYHDHASGWTRLGDSFDEALPALGGWTRFERQLTVRADTTTLSIDFRFDDGVDCQYEPYCFGSIREKGNHAAG